MKKLLLCLLLLGVNKSECMYQGQEEIADDAFGQSIKKLNSNAEGSDIENLCKDVLEKSLENVIAIAEKNDRIEDINKKVIAVITKLVSAFAPLDEGNAHFKFFEFNETHNARWDKILAQQSNERVKNALKAFRVSAYVNLFLFHSFIIKNPGLMERRRDALLNQKNNCTEYLDFLCASCVMCYEKLYKTYAQLNDCKECLEGILKKISDDENLSLDSAIEKLSASKDSEKSTPKLGEENRSLYHSKAIVGVIAVSAAGGILYFGQDYGKRLIKWFSRKRDKEK